jgi:hypothetical protein
LGDIPVRNRGNLPLFEEMCPAGRLSNGFSSNQKENWIMQMMTAALLTSLAVVISVSSAGEAPPPFAGPTAGTAFPVADRFIKRIDLGDVNGDGLLDVVASDNVDVPSFMHFFSVFLNNGDGTLAPPVQSQVQTEGNDLFDAAIALGDLNEDGRADLVTTRLSKSTPPMGNRPNIAILFGAPDGHFVGQVNIANSNTDVFMRTQTGRSIALADMNSDGNLDIVSAASNSAAGNMSVLLGNGDGTFQQPIQSGNGSPHGATVTGDIDGDGDLDVVTYTDIGSQDHAKSAVYVNLSNGAGTLTMADSFTVDAREDSINIEARAFLDDLDGDGLADLILFGDYGQQTGAGGIYIRKSLGNGQFTQVFRETRGEDALRTFTVLLTTMTAMAISTSPRFPAPARSANCCSTVAGLPTPSASSSDHGTAMAWPPRASSPAAHCPTSRSTTIRTRSRASDWRSTRSQARPCLKTSAAMDTSARLTLQRCSVNGAPARRAPRALPTSIRTVRSAPPTSRSCFRAGAEKRSRASGRRTARKSPSATLVDWRRGVTLGPAAS